MQLYHCVFEPIKNQCKFLCYICNNVKMFLSIWTRVPPVVPLFLIDSVPHVALWSSADI